MKTVVIGIHGVGDTKSNFVKDAVTANLRDRGIIDVEVFEYCWNARVEKPLQEGKLRLWAVTGIARSLISAGTLGFGKQPEKGQSSYARILNLLFEAAHFLVSFAVVSAIVCPLLTIIVLLPFKEWLEESLFQPTLLSRKSVSTTYHLPGD